MATRWLRSCFRAASWEAATAADEVCSSASRWAAEQRALRGRVAAGNYEGLRLCSTCFIPRSSNYTEISRDEIAQHQKWEASCG